MAREYGNLSLTLVEGDKVNIENGAVIIEVDKRRGSQIRLKIKADKRLSVRREPRINWEGKTDGTEN